MFGRRKAAEGGSPPPGPGADLRHRVLSLDPTDLGLDQSTGPVWGVVMDTTFADGGWYSLVCLGDGATSIYTHGSFGIIGAGEWPHIKEAATGLLSRVGDSLELFEPARTAEVPPPGYVALRALTWQGQQWVIAPEDDLGNGRHEASGLFYAAHDVIGLVRMQAESSDDR